jgi:two-component system, sensor histidine kinase LadS
MTRMRLTSRRPGAAHAISNDSALSQVWACAAVAAVLLATFQLDRVTGSAPFQHLYYVPIVFAALRLGWRGGLITALAAIVLYHLANPILLTFRYEQADVVQIALFIAIGLVTAKLTADARRLRALAMTDDLTGLHSLRSFEARVKAMIRDSDKARTPLSFIVLDVDRLKALNDTYGHLTGAEAVRHVGHLIGTCVPPDAVACRYGGDEFVVGIPRRTEAEVEALADELRRAVNASAPMLDGRPFAAATLSVSVGLAHRSGNGMDTMGGDDGDEAGNALFRAADRALYVAKENGRNRIAVA